MKISEEANLFRLIQHSLEGRVKFGIGATTCQRESDGIFGGHFWDLSGGNGNFADARSSINIVSARCPHAVFEWILMLHARPS